ncbi:hypothetical protein [Streptomyces qinglanensis]|nr:hypothetical protein [Streptomyces qinglanensis]
MGSSLPFLLDVRSGLWTEGGAGEPVGARQRPPDDVRELRAALHSGSAHR